MARRRQLTEAARTVFEEKGFADTRVADIAKAAGVSHGSFYTYFATKEDAFIAVSDTVVAAMVAGMTRSVPTSDLGDRVRDSVIRFIEVYRPHARFIGLIEQLGTFSPVMRDLRLDLRNVFVQRNRRGIVRMKQLGLADQSLDDEYIAESLGSILEYTCYVWFCLGKRFEEDRVVDTITAIWTKALRPD